MADFKFPSPLFLGRRSVTNDLGLGTILGNASPVSSRWDYLRQQHAEDDGNAGRSGAAPNVEPPPGTPEFREADATLAAFQGRPPGTSTASAAAVLGIADAAESQLGARLAALATRAAPIALAAPSV